MPGDDVIAAVSLAAYAAELPVAHFNCSGTLTSEMSLDQYEQVYGRLHEVRLSASPVVSRAWFDAQLRQIIVDVRGNRDDYPTLPWTPPCRHVTPHTTRTIHGETELCRYVLYAALGWERQGYCWHYVPAFLQAWFGRGPEQTPDNVRPVGDVHATTLTGENVHAATLISEAIEQAVAQFSERIRQGLLTLPPLMLPGDHLDHAA